VKIKAIYEKSKVVGVHGTCLNLILIVRKLHKLNRNKHLILPGVVAVSF
jgi:hypothetical protein